MSLTVSTKVKVGTKDVFVIPTLNIDANGTINMTAKGVDEDGNQSFPEGNINFGTVDNQTGYTQMGLAIINAFVAEVAKIPLSQWQAGL